MDQIESENYPERNFSYGHDSAQNRLKDNQIDRTYNVLDELKEFSSETYTYDLNGNLSHKSSPKGNVDYQYDALNRLVKVEDGDTKITFKYDPLGRKLIKTKFSLKNISQTRYLYDGFQDIGSLDDEGKIQDLRVRGYSNSISRSVAIELKGDAYAPLHDNQGNIRKLVNSLNFEFATKNDFSSFGELLLNEGLFNPWRYAEKRFDPDLDLVDFGKRFYSPTLGRWLTTDPADFIDGMNLYAYAKNNPCRYIDPNGLFVLPLIFIPTLFEISFAGVVSFISAEAVLGVVVGAAIGVGIYQIDQVLDCPGEIAYYNEDTAEEVEKDTAKKKGRRRGRDNEGKGGPPRDPKTKNYLPDPAAEGAHTTFGIKQGTFEAYIQGATFNEAGEFRGRTDVTGHGRRDHPNPHYHPATGPNSAKSPAESILNSFENLI